ncbi:integral membrane protein, partial [Aspergillus sp. HF37]
HGSQQYRSLLASLEILAATAVSNTVVIGSFVRDKGAKKTKFKRDQASASVNNNMDQSSVRRATVTHHQWGSDSDLAADLGIRLEPELYSGEGKHPPPLPSAGPYHALSARAGSLDPNWCFNRQSMGSDDSKMSGSATDSVDIKVSPHEYIETNNTPRKQSGDTGIASSRRVSFMDPGGLLDSDTTQDPEAVPRSGSMASSLHSPVTWIRSPSASASASPNFSRPGVVAGRSYPNGHGRRGSTYSSSSLDSAPPYRGQPDLSAPIDEDVELQDVGGLLSRSRHV